MKVNFKLHAYTIIYIYTNNHRSYYCRTFLVQILQTRVFDGKERRGEEETTAALVPFRGIPGSPAHAAAT